MYSTPPSKFVCCSRVGRPPPSHSCRTLFYPLMALLVPILLPILSQTVFQECFFIWVKWGSEAVRMRLPVLSRTRYLSFFAVKTRVTAYTYIQNTWIMFLPSIFYKKLHFLYSLWCFCVHSFLSCSFYDPYGFTSYPGCPTKHDISKTWRSPWSLK